MEGRIHADLIYQPDELRPYFEHSADAARWVDRLRASVDSVNAFGTERTWEDLADRTQPLPDGYARSLQYYKDETLLTAHALVSLDRVEGADRLRGLDAVMRSALGGNWKSFRAPRLWLEKQISAPRLYQAFQREHGAVDAHPVAYVRAVGREKQNIEGATHVDAVIDDGKRRVLFEAKFLSDISCHTTYDPFRNQIARNLDAGLQLVEGHVEDLYFVLVTPACFRARPWSRLYGHVLNEYRAGPAAIGRDLAHLAPGADLSQISAHIGWVTWEEICAVIRESPLPDDRKERLRMFFEERRLWPSEQAG